MWVVLIEPGQILGPPRALAKGIECWDIAEQS